MQILDEKTAKGIATFTIEVSVEEMDPYRTKAAATISKARAVPGFRPGAAHRDRRVADLCRAARRLYGPRRGHDPGRQPVEPETGRNKADARKLTAAYRDLQRHHPMTAKARGSSRATLLAKRVTSRRPCAAPR